MDARRMKTNLFINHKEHAERLEANHDSRNL